MPGESLLQSLQKFATLVYRLDALTEQVRELESTVMARLDKVEDQVLDLRERLARLEASRDADRAQAEAELARFKVEVERAELRLTRLLPPQSEQRALPEPGSEAP